MAGMQRCRDLGPVDEVYCFSSERRKYSSYFGGNERAFRAFCWTRMACSVARLGDLDCPIVCFVFFKLEFKIES